MAAHPLIVAGDSAGGNARAAVDATARDAAFELAMQILVYPVLAADFTSNSYMDEANQLVLTRAGMRWFWDQYLPDIAARHHPDASPALAADLTGLAPAVVVLAEHDVLRDEGARYAEALREAGVPVDVRVFEGQMHMFFALVGVLPASAAALDYVGERVAAALDGTVSSGSTGA